MRAFRELATRPQLWLECGPRRAPALRARGRLLQVLVWRFAVGWRGGAGAAAAFVLPLAVTERAGARERWWPVPDVTLLVTALGLALGAWIALGGRRAGGGGAPRWRANERRADG